MVDRLSVRAHQEGAHSHRIRVLGRCFGNLLAEVIGTPRFDLNIGCRDVALSCPLEVRVLGSAWSRVSLYPLPEAYRNDAQRIAYHQFDGCALPLERNQFGLAFSCDVLHQSDDWIRRPSHRFAETDALKVIR
jgi:hypothetical protein